MITHDGAGLLVRRARIGLGKFILGKEYFFNSDASLEIDRLTEILRKAEEAMDDMERAGGDAPHRAVDLATRIRFQTTEIRDLIRYFTTELNQNPERKLK